MIIRTLATLTVLALLLSGCALFKVHRVPVQQGNVVTQEMIDTLRLGMTPRQVAFVMGEPVLRDAFQPQRWDYIFSRYDQDRQLQTRRVSVYFDEGLLARIEGDLTPSDDILQAPAPGELDDLEVPGAIPDEMMDPGMPGPTTPGPSPGPAPGPGPTPGPGPGGQF